MPQAPRGLDALLPQVPKNDAPGVETHAIVITVNGPNRVSLNQEDLDLATLETRLQALFRTAPADIAKGAGVHRIGLMTH